MIQLAATIFVIIVGGYLSLILIGIVVATISLIFGKHVNPDRLVWCEENQRWWPMSDCAFESRRIFTAEQASRHFADQHRAAQRELNR